MPIAYIYFPFHHDNAHMSLDKAGADLICGGLFYSMYMIVQIHKYAKLGGTQNNPPGTTRHHILGQTWRHITSVITHTDTGRKICHCVFFWNQKNGEKMEKIVQQKSNRKLCPVWACICLCIRSYPGTTSCTTVNTVQLLESCGTTVNLWSNYIIARLCLAI